MTATIIISKILSNPNTIMLLSMASVAFLEAKIKMAKAPLKIPPHFVSRPKSAFKPKAAPAILPTLKKNHPKSPETLVNNRYPVRLYWQYQMHASG